MDHGIGMSFLDNLENDLKNLEKSAAGEDAGRERDQRKRDVAEQNAVAPWAEKLKKSAFTEELLRVATIEGFRQRTKVYITWMGSTLRLEARERRLELRPAPDGIQTVFLENREILSTQWIDLTGDPGELARHWLTA